MTTSALRILLLTALLATGTGGCTRPGTVPLPEGANYDGLVPIEVAGLKNAWAKPDIDLAGYSRMRLAPVEVQFRATRPGAGSPMRRSQEREFPLSPANQQKLVDTVTEIFREELAKSRRLSLTEDTGADVLLVRTSLIDIVSRVPPEGPGREDFYLDEVGEATLVVEIQDAESGELLARAVDRRAADPPSGTGGTSNLTWTTSVTAWSEVRRLARRWGTVVTRRIDELHSRQAAGN